MNNETAEFKSFNNRYCKDFFTDDIIRKAFKIIVQLIFSNFEPSVLSEKIKFKCCNSTESHPRQCYEKWEELLDYLCNQYFKDIDIIEEINSGMHDSYPVNDFESDIIYNNQ